VTYEAFMREIESRGDVGHVLVRSDLQYGKYVHSVEIRPIEHVNFETIRETSIETEDEEFSCFAKALERLEKAVPSVKAPVES